MVYNYKDLEPVRKHLGFTWTCHRLNLPPLVDDWFIRSENASRCQRKHKMLKEKLGMKK